MKKLLILLFMTLTLLIQGCGREEANETLDIQDVEKIGFIKETEKAFEMIGAIDGWGGSLSGEVVELYVYKDVSSINVEFFDSMKNSMGWEEVCFVSNLALVSTGKTACTNLSSLSTE